MRALAARLAGINVPLSKWALVVGRWSKRLTHHGLRSFGEYLDLIGEGANAAELQISLDLLTMNETNFFRESKHFDFLRDRVLPTIKRGDAFRVWSAACSSGEEPYSIAMLPAAELTGSSWEILGTDISSRVLETARTGLYDVARASPIPAVYLRRFCLKGIGP